MDLQEIEVTIERNGEVRIEVRGVKGRSCMELTEDVIEDKAKFQALEIARGLVTNEVVLPKDLEDMDDEAEIASALAERQIIAIIAYLQKLGAYENVDSAEATAPAITNPDKKHSVTEPESE